MFNRYFNRDLFRKKWIFSDFINWNVWKNNKGVKLSSIYSMQSHSPSTTCWTRLESRITRYVILSHILDSSFSEHPIWWCGLNYHHISTTGVAFVTTMSHSCFLCNINLWFLSHIINFSVSLVIHRVIILNRGNKLAFQWREFSTTLSSAHRLHP